MKIKKVNVRAFGKLKDYEVELNKPFNIIYGENEAGKSTLQTFIKSMFYGLSSKKKGNREKERIQYKPWDGTIPQGELQYEDDAGNLFVIQRKFGNTPRTDNSIVLNRINGKPITELNHVQPGNDLFQLNEEGFERTLLINQLSSTIDSDHGEIERKLSNLHQSGDESISYKEAKSFLIENRKKLTNERKKTNKALLEEYLDKYYDLNEEKILLEKKQEENIEDEIELNLMKKKKDNLSLQIKENIALKEKVKKAILYKDYKKLIVYDHEINQYKEELMGIEKDLTYGDFSCDEAYIPSFAVQRCKNL